MLFTYIWGLGFLFGMLVIAPFLWIYYIIKYILGNRIANKYSHLFTTIWGKAMILTTGSKVRVLGLENIAKVERICFVSNHQSLFDIPLLLGWLDRQPGFIAKKELKKFPILNGWIKAIHSAYIDRSNPRSAIDSINKGIDTIKSGHALVIFPEGTRSKDGKIAEFKAGSLRLATKSNAVIQPVTIIGTRHMYEAQKHIKKSYLTLVIHKPIYPENEIYGNKSLLLQKLKQIISMDDNKLSPETNME